MKRAAYILSILLVIIFLPEELIAQVINFTGEELLGKPTNNSVTVNIVPDSDIEIYYEIGTVQGGPYTGHTDTFTAIGGQPYETVINNLLPDTHYYYRLQYRIPGGSWVIRNEHSFYTQRSSDSKFVFTITSDSHATFNANHQKAMQNVKNDIPDFHIDLGDIFMSGNASSQSAVNSSYLAYRNTLYLGDISPSVPVFIASGNHEDEEGWNFDDTPFSPAIGSIQARKAYYPTPVPDGFYSGNTDLLAAIDETTYGDEYREDYYAWEWGDALFVVIDEFQYTMANPYGSVAGEGSDDPNSADQWIWTLGAQQFNWLKQTLQSSTARYKFVFSHNMLGGIPRNIIGIDAGYVRGGAEAAAYFEWGGKNADGTEGFSINRNIAEFGTKPVHQLLVENGVSAYFHGHDHLYAYEKRDGIVYQEVPSPSMAGSGFSGIYTEGDYGDYQTIKVLPSTGHLRVTVNPDSAVVDYVRSNITGVSYSYTIKPNISPVSSITLTSPNGGQNWLVGSMHNITWTSVNTSGTVRIEYSTNNGADWNNIITNTADNGSYEWTVPNSVSTNCIIRVSDADGDPTDISNAVFTIASALNQHFIPVGTGNGFDHMNFYALTAKIDGVDLEPGDEIGIFDGTACVGSGILTQVLNGTTIYLSMKVSRDDPVTAEIDGYTFGNSAEFRIWDASEESEISAVDITYVSGDNIFTPNNSTWFYISGNASVRQEIILTSGWNIISLHVTPENIDMLAIVQSLIDAGSLVKVQNESGDAIEYNPVSGTWVNYIGNWSNSEGYKIRVNTATTLSVTGRPITETVSINLISGWNIISYPVSTSHNALDVFNPLITAGHLTKVQDESGDAIELNPLTGIWINDIGTFDAGEGYKVKVSTNEVLAIDPAVYGSNIAVKSAKMIARSILPMNSVNRFDSR